MKRSATELIPASRAELWAILAEPLHLPDWWPGLLAVEPDRRGFAPGARWRATIAQRNPFRGRRTIETAILLRDVDLYERWTWQIAADRVDVEIRLHAAGERETEVTVATSRGRTTASDAVHRLSELVRTLA